MTTITFPPRAHLRPLTDEVLAQMLGGEITEDDRYPIEGDAGELDPPG